MNPLVLPLVLSAATPVSRVVVYPDRAQVTRSTQLACGAHALAAFEELPPAADPSSLRASTTAGTVSGLRVEQRPRTALYSKQAEDVANQLRAVEKELQALRDAKDRADQKLAVAQGYTEVSRTQLAKEIAAGKPDNATWNSAVQQQLDQRLEAIREGAKATAEIRVKERARDALLIKSQELAAASAQRAYRAEVIVGCPAGQTATVELTYLVGGAGWQPAYEARADEASGVVELSTYATVRQATGEPWTGVDVTLSTAVPRANATPPEIQPLRVGGYDIGEEHKVLVRRDEQQKHAEVGTAETASTTPGMRAADQGLSVQLHVPDASDVAGDGTDSRLFVAKTRLTAHFALRAVPKLTPLVFRVADVTNTAPFPLLAGTLDAYRNGSFTGRYALERLPQGAPAHLTFGIDDAMRVTRKVVDEIQRDTGLFGGNRRFHYAYRFELVSAHTETRKVELSEHVPISELDDVKVELDKQTTPGFSVKPDDGILTWTLGVAPGETKNIDLAFHVDVPSSYDTSGL